MLYFICQKQESFYKGALIFFNFIFFLCLHFLFYNIDKDSPQKILPNKTTRFWLLTWAFSCVLWDLFEQINKIYVYSAFTPLPFGKELFLSYWYITISIFSKKRKGKIANWKNFNCEFVWSNQRVPYFLLFRYHTNLS